MTMQFHVLTKTSSFYDLLSLSKHTSDHTKQFVQAVVLPFENHAAHMCVLLERTQHLAAEINCINIYFFR